MQAVLTRRTGLALTAMQFTEQLGAHSAALFAHFTHTVNAVEQAVQQDAGSDDGEQADDGDASELDQLDQDDLHGAGMGPIAGGSQ